MKRGGEYLILELGQSVSLMSLKDSLDVLNVCTLAKPAFSSI